MVSWSTRPNTRESWLDGRLSPMTKYSSSPMIHVSGQSSRELRTVGCELEIFAARTVDGRPISLELDRGSLADTKALIDLLSAVSGRHHVDIGLELDGTGVGWLMSGEPDRLIRDGLIGPRESRVAHSH